MKLFLCSLVLLITFFIPSIAEAQYSGVDGSYDTGGGGGGDGVYGGQDNGGYSGCDGGPPTFTIQGKVYQDNNQNGVFDAGDVGIANQTIQMIQQPTNAVWSTATTNVNGDYTLSVPTNTLINVRHSTALPSGAWRVNPTGDTLIVQPNCPRSYNWGIYVPQNFIQNAPVPNCVGNTTAIYLTWTSYSGASNYKILIDDPTDAAGPSDNTITNQLAINLGPGQGLTVGQPYAFIIVALNASGNAIAYSDNGSWSVHKFGTYTTAPTCATPGPFQFVVAPQPYCPAPNDARFLISWTAAAGATSYTVTPQSNQRGWFPTVNVGNTTSYAYPIPAPVTPGEGWEFTVTAYNTAGGTPINGGSSYYAYSNYWAPAPSCTGPAAFSWYAAPAATCIGTASHMLVTWYPSAGATSYTITPQTTNTAKGNNPPGTGWMQPINVGNPGNQPGGFKAYYYPIPGTVATNYEAWEFTVTANNAFGGTNTTGGSSYYHYGWITALNCLPIPGVTFSVTTQNGTVPANSIPARANQNSTVTLNWTTTNSPTSCVGTSSPVQSYWNGSVATSGSQAVSTSTPGGPYIFSLVCTNASGTSANQSIQLTIDQFPKPYIQTTGGDVHTNEDIYIEP